MRQLLKQRALPYAPGGRQTVTLTLGVATVGGGQVVSGDQLLGEAAQALYRGKESGRDRVEAVLLNPAQGVHNYVIPFSA